MPDHKRKPRPHEEPAPPWSGAPGEPEPDWAEEIRAGRRARGERLKEIFATFEDHPKKGRGQSPPDNR